MLLPEMLLMTRLMKLATNKKSLKLIIMLTLTLRLTKSNKIRYC